MVYVLVAQHYIIDGYITLFVLFTHLTNFSGVHARQTSTKHCEVLHGKEMHRDNTI